MAQWANLPARDPASYSEAERVILAGLLDQLTTGLDADEAEALFYDWAFWRRPTQVAPAGRWRTWAVRAGRGFGKTRVGSEETRRRVMLPRDHPESVSRPGIVAPTAGDARDILIEGVSGVLAVHPSHERPVYEPSKLKLSWPNGVIGSIYSAEEPDRLRGPEHDWVWGDEPASKAWTREAWDNISFGLRIGRNPKALLTGTPKPRAWLRELWADATTVVTTGALYENIANLAQPFVDLVLGRYEGTRLGREQIHGDVLEDVEGALWTQAVIEDGRMPTFDRDRPDASLREWLWTAGRPRRQPDRRRWQTAITVDPPGETAECGIAVGMAPIRGRAGFDHAVVIEDASLPGPCRPEQWGAQVVATWNRYGRPKVYVESNQGGDMVRSTVHAVEPGVPVEKIRVGRDESKQARAEPVAALYERGFVHHAGVFPLLESQLTEWVPPSEGRTAAHSPDRLDAVVHLIRVLLPDVRRAPAQVHSPVGHSIPR